MCEVITDDNHCLWFTTDGVLRSFEAQQAYCKSEFGSNLVIIDSSSLFQDVADLSEHYTHPSRWIGLQFSSCNNNNYTLQSVDGTTIKYHSFINWCDGYPNITSCNNNNATYIYFDYTNLSNPCLKNDIGTVSLYGICGDPVVCVPKAYGDETWKEWMYSSIVIAFIISIFMCIASRIFCKHLRQANYNYVDDREPSKAIICTGICYPILQSIQYFLTWILSLVEITACKTNLILSVDAGYIASHYPILTVVYAIIAIVAAISGLVSILLLFPLHMLFR